jgi:outer membrane protein OmpA-like peptidoglycan-associated protein
MKNIFLAILLLTFVQISFSQNLVPDPGFELSPITFDSTWKRTYGTSDLFDSLSRGNRRQNVQVKYFDNPKPHNGIRQLGAIYDHFINGGMGETTHIKLSSSMVANVVYEISMYARLYEEMKYPMEYIPVFFTKEEPKSNLGNVRFTAVKNDKKFVSQYSNWEKITGYYKAEGGEQYLVIGNFKNANYKQLYEKTASPSYYFIDDVSVVFSEKDEPEITTIENTKPVSRFYTQEPVELTFNTKSTDITNQYRDTMNERLTFLKENSSVILKIGGHTDNVGNNESNQRLSEQRAKETAQFFIENGIAENRLIIKGYGEEQPISDNGTEVGRQQNRRVTIDFEMNSFNEIQKKALYDFAKIYGYVRYFHPSDEAQEINWNEFALFGVHELRNCETLEDCQKKLNELFNVIARTAIISENRNIQAPIVNSLKRARVPLKYYEYLGIGGGNDVYKHQLVRIGDKNQERLINREPTEFSVKGDLKLGGSYEIPIVLPDIERRKDPKAKNDLQKKIETTQFFKEDLYIGNTLILWNLAQHFYLYFDELPHLNWENELEKMIIAAIKVDNEEGLLRHLRYCSTLIEDGHSMIGKNRKAGQMWLPFEVELANETFVVTRTGVEGIEVGDIIQRLDGKRSLDIFQADTALISGSDSWKKSKGLTSFGVDDQYSKANIQLKRGNEIKNVRITRDWADYKYDFIQKLENDIYYIKLTDVYNIDTVITRLPDLMNAKGIIWDIRGYLQNHFIKLLPYFIAEKDTTKWMGLPEILLPNQKGQTFIWEGWEIEPKWPMLKMPMIFLTNGKAVSASESFLMFIDHYNIGEIIGEPTAGANGSRNWQSLYGGYRFHWTGMKVRKLNGEPFHMKGVQPDIVIYPEYQDLIKGKDTVLEKAIDMLNE